MASMTQPYRPHVVGPFTPEATSCGELQPGDHAVFDPMFGLERVVERHEHYVGTETIRDSDDNLIRTGAGTGMAMTPGTEWLFVRLLLAYQVADDHNTRYVFRAMQEPITRWRPLA